MADTFSTQVTLRGVPASRRVGLIEKRANGFMKLAGYADSDATGDAEFTLSTVYPTSEFYAFVVDNYGIEWAPNIAVSVGDRIRPSGQFNGVVYDVTTAGILGSSEPTWWGAEVTSPQVVGSASLVSQRFYQPVMHGPVPVDIYYDPYWENVQALLRFDDSLTTNSKGSLVWNVGGGVAQVSGIYGLCAQFDGDDRLFTTVDAGLVGTTDFCIEMMLEKTSNNSNSLVDLRITVGTNQGLLITNPAANPMGIAIYAGDSSVGYELVMTPSAVMPLNTPTHIALSRQGETFRAFMGGELISTGTYSGVIYHGTSFSLGNNHNASSGLVGRIDEFRFTVGEARYTESFTPPSGPLPSIGPSP